MQCQRTQPLRLGFRVLWLWIAWSRSVLCDVRPFAMGWSSKSYGPDGPWNAVQVSLGTPEQQLALYPGGTWESKIILASLCSNLTISSICYAKSAGLFDQTQSSTWVNDTIFLAPDVGIWQQYSLGVADAVPVYASAGRTLDTIDLGGYVVPESDLVGISQAYMIYPGGQNYPLEVGVLSLGAPDINQTFSEVNGTSINGTLVPGYLYAQGLMPSYSYGLHIGSASLNIPGSLYIGGYDQSRVLGSVSTQAFDEAEFPIHLADLSLGVLDGGSPWTFQNKSGLLAAGNSSLSSGLSVLISPADPYIYLPQSACDALAAELPVSYDATLGLYTWHTNDSKFSKLTTSPSYLAFTFWQNGVNNQKFTINVPFALLNLTLEAPLVTQQTQYFPCMPTTGKYVLGRAFLQAAFVGVNWGKGLGNWFLAQAPGPGYSQSPTQTIIEADATTITGSNNSWEDSWSAYWTALPRSSNSSSSTQSPTQSSSPNASESQKSNSTDGLSTGAKAGIGIGCAIAGIIVIALGTWFLHRRGGKQQNARTVQPDFTSKPDQPKELFTYYGSPPLLDNRGSFAPTICELGNTANEGPHELSSGTH